MCDVYGEACFSHKNVYEWAKQGFDTTSLSQKDNPCRKYTAGIACLLVWRMLFDQSVFGWSYMSLCHESPCSDVFSLGEEGLCFKLAI